MKNLGLLLELRFYVIFFTKKNVLQKATFNLAKI